MIFTGGENTHDWWGLPKILSNGLPGWTSRTEGDRHHISAYIAVWRNPCPDKKIECVIIESLTDKSQLMIYAVSRLDGLALKAASDAQAGFLRSRLTEIKAEVYSRYKELMPQNSARLAAEELLLKRERNLEKLESRIKNNTDLIRAETVI
jgi:hypothetical protein